MARTLKSIVLGVVNCHRDWVCRGDLYQEALGRGYEGTQERLLSVADRMARNGEIVRRRRGRMQYFWYGSLAGEIV